MNKKNSLVESQTDREQGYNSTLLPARLGKYYEDTVPDTLDLAECGRLGLNHFTNTIRAELNYEMPFFGDFRYTRPADMRAFMGSLTCCQSKVMEAMPFLRVMSGSIQKIEVEAKMVEMMASMLGEDGLQWVYPDPDKMDWLVIPEEYAHHLGQARMIYAMLAWHQYTGNPKWKKRIDRMVDGIDRLMVVHKNDYAYIPMCGYYEEDYFRSCYLKGRGWKDVSEPATEKDGEESSLFNSMGAYPGALANWYRLTGNKQALRLAGEMVRFLMKPKLWADWRGGEYPAVAGSDHAHWDGHYHGHINTLRSILEYAIVTNDSRLKQFVRDGYEWTRQQSLARIGFVGDGQGCGTGRLIGLAVKMTYEGVGDYWEDVDLYIRNHGTEMQITPEDIPYLNHTAKLEYKEHWDVSGLKSVALNIPYNELINATMGAFPTTPFKEYWGLCCTTHGNMGLFYVWDAILRHFKGVVQVNLLLNRVSPWMDIYSYLPYEGKVVLRNKDACESFVRIPLWVNKDTINCHIGGRPVKPIWMDRYIRFEHLKPKDIITIEFPVLERIEKWKIPDRTDLNPMLTQDWPEWEGYDTYTLRFRGNTLIEIIPGLLEGSPLYKLRPQKYKSNKAPTKQVKRFEIPFLFRW